MQPHHSKIARVTVFAIAALVAGGVLAYAAITVFRFDATSNYIGLRGGPAQVTARILRTPVGEVTGAWHYHPGYVYNVVTQGTITIEDGCGEVRHEPGRLCRYDCRGVRPDRRRVLWGAGDSGAVAGAAPSVG